jgi:hypothetical protein
MMRTVIVSTKTCALTSVIVRGVVNGLRRDLSRHRWVGSSFPVIPVKMGPSKPDGDSCQAGRV